MAIITKVAAREILDSRGIPTVACVVTLDSGITGEAFVPSGASVGENEVLELRDHDMKRFQGKGVLKACANISGPIQELLIGKNPKKQAEIDEIMIKADGTENKSQFGANAILAVSLAVARASAASEKMPLFAYLAGDTPVELPCPMLNIINGGAHADNSLDFQEFMIRPHGFSSFSDSLRAGVEVFHVLKGILKKSGHSTSVGDEGGFAPNLRSHEEALQLIVEAIEKAGYKPRKEISIALDCAANELFDKTTNSYVEIKKMRKQEPSITRTSHEQVDYLASLVNAFPIDSIEDGLAEHDWEGWQYLTEKLGFIQIVGDDIFVTNPKFLRRAIKEEVANAILIKVNQIGTLTETLDTIKLAKVHGYKTVISHRSGETEDTFIADLSVGTNAGQIKTGAPSRSERVAKYNRLLQIEAELGSAARFYHT